MLEDSIFYLKYDIIRLHMSEKEATLSYNISREQTPNRLSSDASRLVIEAAARPTASVLRVMNISMFDREEYREKYPKAEITADEQYVNRARQAIRETNVMMPEQERLRAERNMEIAKSLERLCLFGIQSNAWLGNVRQADGSLPFTTQSAMATEYDDSLHRVDMFTSILIPKAPTNPGERATNVRLTIGFDATTSQSRKTVLEKLTRCQNDQKAKLPFGFTQIKYGIRGKSPDRYDLVPHYTIGLSQTEVSTLEGMAIKKKLPGTQKVTDIRFNAAQAAVTRFTILSEMRAQNDLYMVMLPDELDTKQLKTAKRMLGRMEEILDTAMDECGAFLVKNNLMFKKYSELDLSKERSPDERQSLRNLVEGILNERSRENFSDERRGRPEDLGERTSTYAQIMDCCQELTESAKEGKLDKYRVVGAHTRGFDPRLEK